MTYRKFLLGLAAGCLTTCLLATTPRPPSHCESASSAATPRTCTPLPRSSIIRTPAPSSPACGWWPRFLAAATTFRTASIACPQYTEELRAAGLEIVDSIPALLDRVDAVLIESLDGRKHLEQARPVIAAGKPLFIDKPVAGTLADAMEIYRLAAEKNVPCFSSSSLRFSPGIAGMVDDPKIGNVLGCAAFSPCSLEPHHPDLFWYGVHGVEILFTIMGPGCQTVSRTHTDDTELVVGVWKDGRIGTFRGSRTGPHDYGAMVFGSAGIGPSGGFGGYEPLVVEIAKFFRSGKPPVSAQQTLELFAFMEAADESKRQGGKPVALAQVIEQAQKKRTQPAKRAALLSRRSARRRVEMKAPILRARGGTSIRRAASNRPALV